MPTFEEIADRVRKNLSGAPIGTRTTPTEAWEAQALEALTQQFKDQEKNFQPREVPAAAKNWSLPLQTADALTLGHLPQIAPNVLSPKGQEMIGLPTAQPPVTPTVPGKMVSPEAQQTRAIEAARQAWGNENPMSAVAGTAMGGAPWAFAGAAPGARVASLMPPGLARTVLGGALQGGGAALATSPLSDQPVDQQIAQGALFGGAVNPLTQFARGATGLVSKVTPGQAAAAQGLTAAGIPVRPGQMPEAAAGLKLVDRLFGKGGTDEARGTAMEKLTEFAGKGYHGYPEHPASPSISQAWVDSNKSRVGNIMEDIQKNNNFQPDHQMVNDLSGFLQRAKTSMPEENYQKLYNMVSQVTRDMTKSGTMPGSVYHGWVKRNGTIENYAKDSFEAQAGEFKKILEGTWERSLPSDAHSAWQQAKGQYRLNERLNNSIETAGPKAGELNFKKFLTDVEREYGTVTKANTAIPGMGDIAVGGPLLQDSSHGGGLMHSPWVRHGMLPAASGLALGSYFHDPISRAAHLAVENPSEVVGPAAMVAGTALLGGKAGNRLFNSPAALQRMIAAGEAAGNAGRTSGSPHLFHGVNPLLFGSQATAPQWMRDTAKEGLDWAKEHIQ